MDKCESCVFYLYDEEYDDYVCDMDLPRLVCGVPRQSGVSAAAPGAAHPCKTQETRPKAASLFFPHGRNSARYTPQQAEQQKKRYLPDLFRRRRPAAPLRLSTAAAA